MCLQGFLPELLRKSHVTALLQGNLTTEDAMSIAGSVRAALSDGIMTAAERPLDRVTRLPKGTLLHRSAQLSIQALALQEHHSCMLCLNTYCLCYLSADVLRVIDTWSAVILLHQRHQGMLACFVK